MILPVDAGPPGRGDVFQIRPSGTTFAQSAKLTYQYSDSDVAGTSPSQLSPRASRGQRSRFVQRRPSTPRTTVTAALAHI